MRNSRPERARTRDLGNQPIWANGQRDTSNTFLLNGVDASNLFNGKSTSSVASARIVNNTGSAAAASSSAVEHSEHASPYLAIGQALADSCSGNDQEVRVNTSMYDAQQGSTSGAHIDMSTASGTNDIHGQAVRAIAEPIGSTPRHSFSKQDPNIPENEKIPELHRYIAGGTFGGPIIKNKLFGFIGYQHLHDSDQEIGLGARYRSFGLHRRRIAAPLAPLRTLTNCVANIISSDFADADPAHAQSIRLLSNCFNTSCRMAST